MTASTGPAADVARSEVRAHIGAEGHAVDHARAVIEHLERAFAHGSLQRTPMLDRAIEDLRMALAQAEGQRLGGRSAEASRLILRAIDRGLDSA